MEKDNSVIKFMVDKGIDKLEGTKIILNGETLKQTLFRDVHDIANSCDKDSSSDIESWVSHVIATFLMYDDGVKSSTVNKEAVEKKIIKKLNKLLDDYAGDSNPDTAKKYYIPGVAKSILSLIAEDRVIKEIAEKLLLMIFHDHDMKEVKNYLECLSTVDKNRAVDTIIKAKPSTANKCGMCGGNMSENPHPEAGEPNHYLTVGTVLVCIPCIVKSRHNWAERAMIAEGKLAKSSTANREAAKVYCQGCYEGISDRCSFVAKERPCQHAYTQVHDLFSLIEPKLSEEEKKQICHNELARQAEIKVIANEEKLRQEYQSKATVDKGE